MFFFDVFLGFFLVVVPSISAFLARGWFSYHCFIIVKTSPLAFITNVPAHMAAESDCRYSIEMNSVGEKLAGMRWLLMKPPKFFEDVVRKGRYVDGLIFMAVLAILIGIGSVVGDSTIMPEAVIGVSAKVSGLLLAGFVVITAIWGVLAALIGMRLRPRISAVLSFKEAAMRCLRIVSFSLAPLALLFFHGDLLLSLALMGVLILSVIGVAKALSIKILPALILQAMILGGIVGGSVFAIETFMREPARQPHRQFPAHRLIGKPAPDILIQPTGGAPIRLSQLKGKVVIIDFWATWCAPCQVGLPIIGEVASKYKDRDVVFYAIGEGNVGPEKAYLEQHQIDAIPAITNADGAAAFLIGPIPQTAIIDKAGIVKYVQVGLSRYEREELTSEIEAALQAK